MRRNVLLKKITSVLLAVVMTFGLTACGSSENGGNGSGSSGSGGNGSGNGNSGSSESGSAANNGSGAQGTGGKADDGDYVYLPRYYDLPSDEQVSYASYGSAVFDEGRLYYLYSFIKDGESNVSWRYIDVANPEAGAVEVMDLSGYNVWTEDSATDVVFATVGEDDGVILEVMDCPLVSSDASAEEEARQHQETVYSLKKVAADGTELFDVDITPYLHMDMNNSYVQEMFTDEEGNLYISNGASHIWVFDRQGNHKEDISLAGVTGYVTAANILPDGRLGALHSGQQIQLSVYNPDTKQFSDTYNKLPPQCFNSNLAEGPNGGVLLYSDGLYEYDMETETYTALVKWTDCDINPNNIREIAAMEDGGIAVYCSDWSAGTETLVVLERVEASAVVEKEMLTLGCMTVSSTLQAAIVEFNKNSNTYKIEIKNYGESVDYSVENAYEDARTQFYNDIITGKAPDMFLVDDVGINMEVLAVKGLIEDLAPYLDGSTVVRREELFETILNAYTIDGILCAIPRSFSIQTLAGRTAEVGEESGWTLEEMIAFAEAHPETPLLPDASKLQILVACMMFDFDSWVNWETGECFFDTPEFKAVLEFANRYPAEADESLPSAEEQIMAHMALLDSFGLSDARSWQVQRLIFGEPITAIGYPSANSNGVRAFGDTAVCISTTCKNKDVAWSFIETLLTEKAQEDVLVFNFPVRISSFEKKLAEAMEPYYAYDANGEIQLDENGNPKEVSRYSYGWAEGLVIEVYAVTQEEADGIRHVISQVDGLYIYDRSMMNIILEEIEPYFAGQKSVDEAAGIIQSRVQLYVSESR